MAKDYTYYLPASTDGGGGLTGLPITLPTGSYRILYVSEQVGNDSTAIIGRLDKPFQFIQTALLNAVLGDIIYMLPGQCNESTVNASITGTTGRPIHIIFDNVYWDSGANFNIEALLGSIIITGIGYNKIIWASCSLNANFRIYQPNTEYTVLVQNLSNFTANFLGDNLRILFQNVNFNLDDVLFDCLTATNVDLMLSKCFINSVFGICGNMSGTQRLILKDCDIYSGYIAGGTNSIVKIIDSSIKIVNGDSVLENIENASLKDCIINVNGQPVFNIAIPNINYDIYDTIFQTFSPSVNLFDVANPDTTGQVIIKNTTRNITNFALTPNFIGTFNNVNNNFYAGVIF